MNPLKEDLENFLKYSQSENYGITFLEEYIRANSQDLDYKFTVFKEVDENCKKNWKNKKPRNFPE